MRKIGQIMYFFVYFLIDKKLIHHIQAMHVNSVPKNSPTNFLHNFYLHFESKLKISIAQTPFSLFPLC